MRPEDPDLALLAGDRLYALGLARLAELGDLDAVAELADVISLAAQAHAEGDAERAEAMWAAGAAAVGHGSGSGARGGEGGGARRRPTARPARCGPPRQRADLGQVPRRQVGPVSLARRYGSSPRHGRRTQRPQEQVHARPRDAGRVRGRDGHAPPVHDPHGARRGRGRRHRVRAARRSASPPARRCSTGPPVEWKPIGAPDDFLDDTYLPARDHRGRRHRPGRQDHDLRPRGATPRSTPRRTRPASTSRSSRSRRAACTSAAPSATSTRPSASCARATAASTTSTARSTAGRRSVRSTASTPASATARSRSAARYSVNSEFRRHPSYRDPAQDLDGIGQYLYPGRFSTPKNSP